jgi:hypothetical protein
MSSQAETRNDVGRIRKDKVLGAERGRKKKDR